ncbi:MAG: acyl-CoA dehydrogenase [Solirubrobacteraceae bacterium]
MNFAISTELRELVDRTRVFSEEELAPLEPAFLQDGWLDEGVRLDLQLKARDGGLWAIDVPVELGGAGYGHVGHCLVTEELYKSPLMFDFGGSPYPVLYEATDDQKRRYLHPVVEGTKRGVAVAFTEPSTGSDLGAIETTAVRDGEHYVINGEKKFIGFVDRSDYLLLFASTDRDAGARGISVFLVDVDTPGFEVLGRLPTMGDGWWPFELRFEDMRVSAANLLGEPNEGFRVADTELTHGRLWIAAIQLGLAQRAIDVALEHARQRTTWGQPIGSRQGVQFMLADSQVELEAARALVYKAAWLADNGEPFRQQTFMAKLYATEMAQRVTDRCLQIMGGLGYLRECPIQSLYRQARVWRIGHGTAEIHRWMIARDMLGPVAAVTVTATA